MGGDANVWLLDPPDNLDPDGDGFKSEASGWTLRSLNPSGTAPACPHISGVFGKWVYLPNEQVYLGVIDPVAGDVFAYKPSYNTISRTVDLKNLTLSSSIANGCNNVSGAVTLNVAAPAGGYVVLLSDDLASAATPPQYWCPGALTASFSIPRLPCRPT